MNTQITCKPTPELLFGTKTFLKIPQLVRRFGSNLLILTGGNSFLGGSHWPALEGLLKQQGFSFTVEQITGEPSPEAVDSIMRKCRTQRVDVVIAIGGGSVLDGGKAVSAMLIEQKPVADLLEGVGTTTPSGKKTPFIAVPTTSGTGSEATANAVISKVGKNGFKKSLRHINYIPNIAVVDPLLTVSCPRNVTIACGMDTLTQLIEAFLSLNGSPLTDLLALEGIRHVVRSIERVADNKEDLPARADMAYGSYLSGIVLANAGLGTVHGFASALGGLFPIPHGVVCGTLMAETNRQTLQHLRTFQPTSEALDKYANLGRLVCEKSSNDRQAQDGFIKYLLHLTQSLNISPLGAYGITIDDLDAVLDLTENKYNPAPLSREEHKSILLNRLNL